MFSYNFFCPVNVNVFFKIGHISEKCSYKGAGTLISHSTYVIRYVIKITYVILITYLIT